MKVLEPNFGPNLEANLLDSFNAFLEGHFGIYFAKDRLPELKKKGHTIAIALGYKDLATCVNTLLQKPLSPSDIDILTHHLTIGETSFFRDRRFFAALEKQILPDLIKARRFKRSLRLWSAGCATGEEPYSLAMLLHSMLLRSMGELGGWTFNIIGSDINAAFLSKARQSLYTPWAFRNTPEELRSQFFTKDGKGLYRLNDTIRSKVTFVSLNLASDSTFPPWHQVKQCDLILCHNVLIYFSPEQITKTVDKLAAHLTDGGWLSLSAIEVPYITHPYLKKYYINDAVFFKKEIEKMSPMAYSLPLNQPPIKKNIPISPPLHHFAKQAEPREMPQESTANRYEHYLGLLRSKNYHGLCEELQKFLEPYFHNPVVLKTKSKEAALLIRALADQGSLDKAELWCSAALNADKLNIELHYLYANILYAKGNLKAAVEALQKTLFLDADYIAAYYLLGTILASQGHKKTSQRHFSTARQLLHALPPETYIAGFEDMTAEGLKALIPADLATPSAIAKEKVRR